MSITALTTTTLSAAIAKDVQRFTVASTANIVAGGYLAVDAEIMRVLAVPVSGTVDVMRGVDGTEPAAHVNAARVYIAAAALAGGAAFQRGNAGEIILGGDPTALPKYRLPLGTRARDAIGNEFVLVDFTGTVYSGMPVAINADYTAAAPGVTGRGAIGVAAEPATSDQWGWVQIYGRCLAQVSYNAASPSDAANGPTTVQTSLQTKFILQTTQSTPIAFGYTSALIDGWYIDGMWVAQDAAPADVSAISSAASHVGAQIAVFLNYPHIEYRSVSGA